MSRRTPYLSFAVASALAAGACVSGAAAYPAAQIDQEIRPNFGILLKPELRRFHHEPWRGRRYGYDGYGYRPNYPPSYSRYPPYYPPYPGQGLPQSLTVDCADPSLGPTPISDAASWVADGGVVYVRARGVACKETLEIEHPVVIAGEDSPAFSTNPSPSPVVIAPPEGQPCVLIAQGVKEVELRGLKFQADKGLRTSCIQAWDSELALVRDHIDYTGDASAVYVSGGKLIVRESRIDAHTYDAAVLTEHAGVDMYKVRVSAETAGLDLTLGPPENSIEQVGVLTPRNGPPGSSGILVRGERSGGSTLRVKNATVCGFRVGFALERASKVEIRRSRVCRSGYGVMAEGADFGITESAIGADHIGVYVASGSARVDHNRIYDVFDDDDGIVSEPGAGVMEDANWIFSKYDCKHFRWGGGRESCKPLGAVPAGWRDESSFDRDDPEGWNVDGYDQGYTRDGPVAYFDKPKPPPKPHKKLRIFDFR